MIVNNVNSAANLYSAGATRYASAIMSARSVQKKDELTLSKQAQSFKDMLQKLQGESDVRQDKVDEFEQKISSGNYNVSAENIAASILSVRF